MQPRLPELSMDRNHALVTGRQGQCSIAMFKLPVGTSGCARNSIQSCVIHIKPHAYRYIDATNAQKMSVKVRPASCRYPNNHVCVARWWFRMTITTILALLICTGNAAARWSRRISAQKARYEEMLCQREVPDPSCILWGVWGPPMEGLGITNGHLGNFSNMGGWCFLYDTIGMYICIHHIYIWYILYIYIYILYILCIYIYIIYTYRSLQLVARCPWFATHAVVNPADMVWS